MSLHQWTNDAIMCATHSFPSAQRFIHIWAQGSHRPQDISHGGANGGANVANVGANVDKNASHLNNI